MSSFNVNRMGNLPRSHQNNIPDTTASPHVASNDSDSLIINTLKKEHLDSLNKIKRHRRTWEDLYDNITVTKWSKAPIPKTT